LLILMSSIDCEQSLFCSEIRGEEPNEESKTSVTAIVTCEWRAVKPRAASSAGGSRLRILRSHAHDPPLACFAFFFVFLASPRIFEQERDCSQSMSSTKKFACNALQQLFLYCDQPFRMDLVTIYYSSFSV